MKAAVVNLLFHLALSISIALEPLKHKPHSSIDDVGLLGLAALLLLIFLIAAIINLTAFSRNKAAWFLLILPIHILCFAGNIIIFNNIKAERNLHYSGN